MQPPLCSIIISSYNKDKYVGLAVDSALSQTWPGTEVIVVDDGSTDESVPVLEKYGDRIVLIRKSNGGQASAMNLGFQASRGDIVFFLDCDDLLDADTVARVAAIWTPALSKVHFRLRKIRGDGSEVEGELMPPYRPLPAGDIHQIYLRFGFYPAPPTSGNAFARRVLEAVMPLPEPTYRAWPDTLLIGMAPLFGAVAKLDGIGGSWRQTEGNYSRGGLDKVRAKLVCDDHYIATARAHAGGRLPAAFSARWPQHLRDKLILTKFAPAAGAGIRESPAAVALDLVRTVLNWPEYTWRARVWFCTWALGMALVPRVVLRRIPGVVGPFISVA
jgi:glycosyltransferase involved in cell wall biosynthesis